MTVSASIAPDRYLSPSLPQQTALSKNDRVSANDLTPQHEVTPQADDPTQERRERHAEAVYDNPVVRFLLSQKGAERQEADAPPSGAEVRPENAPKNMTQNIAGAVGNKTWMFPGLSNMALGVEKSDGSAVGMMAGAKTGLEKTLNDGLETSIRGAAQGSLMSIFKGYAEAVAKNEATPAFVKEVVIKLLDWLSSWGRFSSSEPAGKSRTAPTGI
ncbi:hypothetical protein M2399_004362 [Pseudomonas sp. BIGb0450]|uniref:hypothetical protein n=1 Tax=unclassified Pseudomonas TaxID=196821 RepID=UPI00216A3F86|nr:MULTISPECIES: hypothetical protein [unclassified Pseudomonas]MCS3419325.1 hypothetical protein [Pseudomonas sp. BIGb0558]MCS3438907.1 hypothetical protein [Pseudomonas sp. BIGb0450]